MKIKLDIKPLSVNVAWQGRRFSTPAKKQYEEQVLLMLPKQHIPGPYYRIDYKFFLVNFKMTDQQNLLKCLTDCLVKRGIITDDRFIIDERIRKYPSAHDGIELEIEGIGLHEKN
jgi:Holliday junction resolvase RusA-like endonuclease